MMYELLDHAFAIVRAFGLPLAILAWITVVAGALAMGRVLRRADTRGVWGASLLVGGLAFAGHAADITVTLIVSPDLELEANPIWMSVRETCGMAVAIAHALSGQLLVVVLSAQLFAWYLVTRRRLEPSDDRGFVRFVLDLGADAPRRFGIRWWNLLSLFAFLFATLGPYSFYVAFLNAIVRTDLRAVYPSPPAAVSVYLLGATALYFVLGYRAFRRRTAAQPRAAASTSGQSDARSVPAVRSANLSASRRA